MLNYGEEIAYWYLRLNGFFMIENFVIHRSGNGNYRSDIDIIAVRFPYVIEKIGGQPSDWDASFFEKFNKNKIIGLICEVKTGHLTTTDIHELFNSQNVSDAVGRFGFTSDYKKCVESVQENRLTDVNPRFQIAKVLFSNNEQIENNRFFHFPLSHLIKFLQNRSRKYRKEKYRSRMFFPSILMQYIFETTDSDSDVHFNE
jgi:hypothetical protein